MSGKPQPTGLAMQVTSLSRDLEAYVRAWEEANEAEAETDVEVFSVAIATAAHRIERLVNTVVKVTS